MSEEKNKEQLEYEARLRRRLKILQEQFKAGKVKIAEGLNVESSLLAVRSGPDGEVDLDTVDGLVRSLALGITAMHDREELKKETSLSEIQNMYFNFIERNFGDFYKIMVERGLTPHDAGLVVTQNQNSIAEITKNLEEFLGVIDEFWEGVGEIAYIHVEDMHGNIKGIFGGDLFPSHDENIASKCGIYTDTIILPDPFLRSKLIFDKYSLKEKARYLMKHAMNILQYKDLACADVATPIVVVLPDQAVLQNNEEEFYHSLAKEDSLIHAGKLFGRKFESNKELLNFSQSLDTIEKAVAEIKDNERVLFDTEWKGDTKTQIAKAMNSKHSNPFGDITPGEVLSLQFFGRMGQTNELLLKSQRLNATPIIDAPTSWQYFNWKLEYDAERCETELKSKDLHIVRGLQDLANGQMKWLGKIPADALIEIRKQGAMDEIRNILGSGINQLIEVNPEKFHESKSKIFDNMNLAFHQHLKNIDELSAKQWKFAGKDIGSWLVVGTIEVAAVIIGSPVCGIATIAANQLADVPKLKDIPKSIRKLADESDKLKKSPVGMLFSISNRNA